MRFLDWLLGQSNIGWAKTALLSAFIGAGIFALLGWGDLPSEYGEPGRGKAYFILLGFPILWTIRKLYWSYRRNQIEELITNQDPAAYDEISRLKGRNDRLMEELDSFEN